jgi:hypothetical protein
MRRTASVTMSMDAEAPCSRTSQASRGTAAPAGSAASAPARASAPEPRVDERGRGAPRVGEPRAIEQGAHRVLAVGALERVGRQVARCLRRAHGGRQPCGEGAQRGAVEPRVEQRRRRLERPGELRVRLRRAALGGRGGVVELVREPRGEPAERGELLHLLVARRGVAHAIGEERHEARLERRRAAEQLVEGGAREAPDHRVHHRARARRPVRHAREREHARHVARAEDERRCGRAEGLAPRAELPLEP